MHAQLREVVSKRSCDFCVCHPQFNAEGTSLAFLYRVGACPKFYGEYFRTYLFTIDVTGHNLWRVPVAEGSFHDYGAQGRLLVSEKARCFLSGNDGGIIMFPKDTARNASGMCFRKHSEW